MCGKPLIMTMSRLDYNIGMHGGRACTACSEHGLRQAGTVKLADNRCWQFIHDKAELKLWVGAHSLQHGHFADKVNNRPGKYRVLCFREELFLVLVKLKTADHNQ